MLGKKKSPRKLPTDSSICIDSELLQRACCHSFRGGKTSILVKMSWVYPLGFTNTCWEESAMGRGRAGRDRELPVCRRCASREVLENQFVPLLLAFVF